MTSDKMHLTPTKLLYSQITCAWHQLSYYMTNSSLCLYLCSPYYVGHFYDGYRYAFPPPYDSGMYTSAYGAYPVYGTHQQQFFSFNFQEHLGTTSFNAIAVSGNKNMKFN
ncbi:hypothetical protein AABB24_003272 [Solanum stoloniferum]|uniref:Uncharacterized protein n=1 Tax=Solanum stoloniferum TaxID=62892 RepID=A0ABD2V7F2_9SOLN